MPRSSSVFPAPAKTTLSADSSRTLIGDDEHGWSDQGVFNFEGGCYAKSINLTAETEPEIFAAASTFGTIVENVAMDENTRVFDFFDSTLTENGRLSYDISQIPECVDGRPRRPTAEHRHVDVRCVWRVASHQPVDAGNKRCTTSCPATPLRLPGLSGG